MKPAGVSKSGSPFDALKELIAQWPANSLRRTVILVSNGMNPAAGEKQDPSAEGAIEAAERAGVTVYGIDRAGPD